MDFPGMRKPEMPKKLPGSNDAAGPTPRWLGLVSDHRRLFDALQDGWLRPRSRSAGLVAAIGAYADDPDGTCSGHPIPVRIKLDAEKLPSLDISVVRGSRWIHSRIGAIESSDIAVYWPGSLPVFAIFELEVANDEERARLKGMARQFSNVELPDAQITVRAEQQSAKVATGDIPSTPPVPGTRKLDIPTGLDPFHGAMSMAVWAVPRIDPWLDVLVASLSPDHERLPKLAAAVKAGWWRFPPWMPLADAGKPRDLQDRLWLAAVDVLRRRPIDGGVPPRALAEQIARAAVHPDNASDEVSGWLRATQRILRADSIIEVDGWRASPVGMAIQLVLTRPEPTRFKTWHQDMPSLPPAVWWSAAVLCGLHHGYRRLDTRFRGKAEQQAFIAAHALRACTGTEIHWPALSGKPHWSRVTDGFTLFWGDKTIAHKPDKTHGKWYAANFEEARVRNSAMRVAKDLGWSCCWSQRIELPEGSRVPFAGSLTIRDEENSSRKSAARRFPATPAEMTHGTTGQIHVREPTTMRLPAGYVIEEVLDVESFRHQVSVTGVKLPEPPPAGVPVPVVERVEVTEVPGLSYVRNFLDEAEETTIISQIDQGDWIKDLPRRVQHYGWRYDYKGRRVDPAMRLGELPAWANALARRLFDTGLIPNLPDQVIVNEYCKEQGIGRHVDSDSFDDGIAMVSLLESWGMIFRPKRDKRKFEHMLERRSVVVIRGEARYEWTHEIPKRKSEPSQPGPMCPRRPRKRRISLTFRKVVERNR